MGDSNSPVEAFVYRASDYPHGLRCAECSELFIEGQPIAERPEGMDEFAGDAMFCATLICVRCSTTGGA